MCEILGNHKRNVWHWRCDLNKIEIESVTCVKVIRLTKRRKQTILWRRTLDELKQTEGQFLSTRRRLKRFTKFNFGEKKSRYLICVWIGMALTFSQWKEINLRFYEYWNHWHFELVSCDIRPSNSGPRKRFLGYLKQAIDCIYKMIKLIFSRLKWNCNMDWYPRIQLDSWMWTTMTTERFTWNKSDNSNDEEISETPNTLTCLEKMYSWK